MKILQPLLAAALFFVLVLFFTPSLPSPAGPGSGLFYAAWNILPVHFNPASTYTFTSLLGRKLTITPVEGYFLSSPFNMETEGNPLYNLFLPTMVIFLLGLYLKNFNKSFQRKCRLRAVFIMAIIASYVKSVGSMLYYRGYSDFGISLGTSIITLCFLAAFLISLEVYIEHKEAVEHIYGHFMFALLTCLVFLLAVMVFFSFFASSSFLVHAMGLTAFLIMFIPFYERQNIWKFMRKEEKAIATMASGGTRRAPARSVS